ncbi:hypothetical protein ACH4TV_31415 [Streptomyces sp. NPDC020898]|uniref:hypothetical protein n=1 Tax=Streptomyces sp. NPDC020898 TaxID=3365101 RepID=UPI0037BB92E8
MTQTLSQVAVRRVVGRLVEGEPLADDLGQVLPARRLHMQPHSARYELHGQRVAFTTRSHLKVAVIAVCGTWSNGWLTLGLAGTGWEIKPRHSARLDAARR